MDSRIKGQLRQVALQRSKEVIAEISAALPLVEKISVAQIVLGGAENNYLHATSSRN